MGEHGRYNPEVSEREIQERSRQVVSGIATRRWEQVRPFLRWRVRPNRRSADHDGFVVERVLDLPASVVRVDEAMQASWGVPRASQRHWALTGAARGITTRQRATVSTGRAKGAEVIMAVGGAGTNALALEPALLWSRGDEGHRHLAVVGLDDRFVVAARAPPPGASDSVEDLRALLGKLAGAAAIVVDSSFADASTSGSDPIRGYLR